MRIIVHLCQIEIRKTLTRMVLEMLAMKTVMEMESRTKMTSVHATVALQKLTLGYSNIMTPKDRYGPILMHHYNADLYNLTFLGMSQRLCGLILCEMILFGFSQMEERKFVN